MKIIPSRSGSLLWAIASLSSSSTPSNIDIVMSIRHIRRNRTNFASIIVTGLVTGARSASECLSLVGPPVVDDFVVHCRRGDLDLAVLLDPDLMGARKLRGRVV